MESIGTMEMESIEDEGGWNGGELEREGANKGGWKRSIGDKGGWKERVQISIR